MVQGLGLSISAPGDKVQSLVWKLRFPHNELHSQKKKTERMRICPLFWVLIRNGLGKRASKAICMSPSHQCCKEESSSLFPGYEEAPFGTRPSIHPALGFARVLSHFEVITSASELEAGDGQRGGPGLGVQTLTLGISGLLSRPQIL